MKQKVLLFATLRERAGNRKFVEVDVNEGINVGRLKELLAEEYPTLKPSLKSVLVTINREYARDDRILSPGMEIAMFPPVSGG